jgi:hypothetical protein
MPIFSPFLGKNILKIITLVPGPNPTTAIYNASAVKIYNGKTSLPRFENKNIFFYFEKPSSLTPAL